jgi:2-oxo-4-hydroxy-4-carboxy--5-ureidoimidazoline (OHCU) decarboxylase
VTTVARTEQSDTIKAGERTELRRLVRMTTKLLRAQIIERHATQMAEIDGRIAAKFCEDKTRVEALRAELDRLVNRANRSAEAIIAKYPDVAEPRSNSFSRPWITRPEGDKNKLRKAMIAAVNATTKSAQLRVAQLETELLTALALDALRTDAAKEFVSQIPDIDELMPSDQPAQIEQQFDEGATQ